MKNTNYLKEELYKLIKTDELIFDFIQESSLDGLWYWDLEHPEEEWMNPKFWSVLGYDYREMPHKASAWKDIIHPEDLKLATEKIIKHFENSDYPYNQTVRYTHKNGSTVWIRCRGLAIRDKQGKPLRMLGAHHNITELKNNELLLERSNSLLSNAQQVSKIGSWELDLKTNEVVWSEELSKMYGFDPTLSPPLYPEQKKQFSQESWEALTSAIALTEKQGIPYELELKTIRTDESNGWMWVRGEAVFDENKNIVGLRGVAQDITDKKILELEKEALSKRLSYALDASGDGIWDAILTDGKTVYSKAWLEMLGYEVGELASLSSEWSDRLHPDDAEWVFAAINKVTQTPKNGVKLSHEYRFRNKAGDYLWILNKAKVVERNEKGVAIRLVGTHSNITERKKAEEELKKTTSLLEAVQSQAKMGTWELDLTTGKTFWTDEVYRIHEVEKDFDHNKAVGIDFFHPDHRHIILKAVTDSIEQQTPYDVKCKFITAKNNHLWVRSSGYPVIKEGKLTHIIGLIEDISQEEANREAIVQEQMFSKQLLENMAEGFSVVDVEGRQIVVNKAFCEMTEFSENELIGQTAPFPYWPSEELENIGKAFQQTLAGDLSTFELTFQKKNGERFPVQVSTGVLKDEYGNTINYFANIKDITTTKKENQHLNMSLQLAQLENLKNQLNPHFLFNSLNSIKALTLSNVFLAREAIIELAELLRTSLDFKNASEVYLYQEISLVEKYLKLEKIRFEDRLNYTIDMSYEVQSLKILPMSIQLLAENAIKHGVSNSKKGGYITISGYRENDFLYIKVKNGGKITINSRRGIGLDNLDKRLLLNYGKEAKFTLYEMSGEVVAEIQAPCLE